MRALLIHGAATDSRVWSRTVDAFEAAGINSTAPDRAMTGNMEAELEALWPLCGEDAIVIGVSGGATLGLALAMRGVPMHAAFLHEPAAGSLAPGLLNHVAQGLATGGVQGFGTALYGSSWSLAITNTSADVVATELAMFSRFEPGPLPHPERVTLTVGELSPPARCQSVAALSAALGLRVRVLRGVSHAAHLEGGFESLAEELKGLLEL